MGLASLPRMKRGVAVFVAGAAALVLYVPRMGDVPRAGRSHPGPAQAREDDAVPEGRGAYRPSDAVIVSHELVTAGVIREPVRGTRSGPRRSVPAGTLHEAARRERPGLVSRTARVLFGNGRHRPEPFPRPRE